MLCLFETAHVDVVMSPFIYVRVMVTLLIGRLKMNIFNFF